MKNAECRMQKSRGPGVRTVVCAGLFAGGVSPWRHFSRRFWSLVFLHSAFCILHSSSAAVPPTTAEGFRVPQPGAELAFPAAHGSHPDFRIEWWYLTGNLVEAGADLTGDEGQRFGFQATFFRYAAPLASPDGDAAEASAAFGTSQLYMAHMAVTDVTGARFFYEERLNRDGWDAYAKVGAMDVRNGDWTLVMTDPATEEMQLRATIRGRVNLDFTLSPDKPLVRFGPDGTSRKGPAPESRSYYLSFTRLATEGSLAIDGQAWRIEGLAWMDHEIASNQLSDNLEGWDWTAIQLDDGRELKAYILRKLDGTPDAFSAAMWIEPDNTVTYVDAAEFTWEGTQFFESTRTGATYPIGVALTLPDPARGGALRTLDLVPLLDDQELGGERGGIAYWEGALRIDEAGQRVGHGYLELVGYDKPVEGLR